MGDRRRYAYNQGILYDGRARITDCVAISHVLCVTGIARDDVEPSMIQYSAELLRTIMFIRIELAHAVFEESGTFICLGVDDACMRNTTPHPLVVSSIAMAGPLRKVLWFSYV